MCKTVFNHFPSGNFLLCCIHYLLLFKIIHELLCWTYALVHIRNNKCGGLHSRETMM